MTVEELEAAVWQAMRDCKVTTYAPVAFVDKVVAAAVLFAGGDSAALQLLRRMVLEEASHG